MTKQPQRLQRRIIRHWMPDQTVTPTIRKFGMLYRLKVASVSKTGGVLATYELL